MEEVTAEETKLYEELLGSVMTNVVRADYFGQDCLDFYRIDGEMFRFWHNHDCCETVEIEDVIGELSDLVGKELTMAESVSSRLKDPKACDSLRTWLKDPEACDRSRTWTFYKFATVKGYVTVRWLGESNGYYSEEVDFDHWDKEKDKASGVTP